MRNLNPLFIIEKRKEKHDPRYFVMLNASVAVSGDEKYEGGDGFDSARYYHDLLNIEIPNLPASLQLIGEGPLQLTNDEFAALNKGIKQLKEIAEYLKLENRWGTSKIFTDTGLKELLNKIDSIADANNGICYLPSGYTGDPGHYVTLKMRRLPNGHYAFSMINQGEGMQFHRLLGFSGGKEKRSYQSEEYEVDLRSKDGQDVFKKILELNYTAQQSKSDPNELLSGYSSDDLYGHMKLGQKEIPLTEKLDEKAVTSQRTGSCTVTNMHATGKDILMDHDVDFKKRKHYHFVLKLRSIIAAYNDYCNGEMPRNVLAWALNEFSTRLNKNYGDILTAEDIIFCGELKNLIHKHLKEDEAEELKRKCEHVSFPEATAPAPATIKLKNKEKQNAPPPAEEKAQIETKEALKITPENIWNIIRNFPVPSPFPLLYDFFNALPHCSGEAKDAFWDKVPEFDVQLILDKLFYIAEKLSSDNNLPSQERVRTFALALMLYDIAAQLAPRYKHQFYGGFKLGDRYAFGLDDVYSEQTFYTDPVAYQTVKRVVNNFAKRSQGKERVFTNAVNYDDNKHDQTIKYVIQDLLTPQQRRELEEAKKKTEKSNHDNFTDEQLFDFLVKDIDRKYLGEYNDGNYKDSHHDISFLDPVVIKMIGIAATAHALGEHKKTYNKIELSDDNVLNAGPTKIYTFAETRFQHEVMRDIKLQKLSVTRHLPPIEKTNTDATNTSSATQAEFSVFDENTIYHPHDDLTYMQELNLNFDWNMSKPSARMQPYQFYLSGSLNPDAKIWFPQSKKRLIYEGLNTALRQIECSPNLQIQRTLAFITNNIDKLELPEIRDRVNELLFQYGKLEHAIANQFTLSVANMDQMLTVALKHCKEIPQPKYDLVRSHSNPQDDAKYNPDQLKLINNSGYILFADTLYFVDKAKRTCDATHLSPEALTKLKQSLRPEYDVARTLNNDELRTIQEISQHNIPEDHEFLTWAARLSMDLRNQMEVTAKLHQLPIEDYSLPDFQPILLTTLQQSNSTYERAKLASLVVQNYQYQSPLTLQDCCVLLTCRLIANIGDEGLSCDIAWDSLNQEIQSVIHKDRKQFQKIFASVQSEYIKLAEKPAWVVTDKIIKMSGTDNHIDIRTGRFESTEEKDLKDRTERTIAENSKLFDKLNLTKSPNFKLLYGRHSKKQIIRSSDGLWEFAYDKRWNTDTTTKYEITDVYQWFELNDVKTKFKLMNEKEVRTDLGQRNPFEVADTDGQYYQYWQSTEDESFILAQNKLDKAQVYTYYGNEKLILMNESVLQVLTNKMNKNDFKISDAIETLRDISERNNDAPIIIKYNWGMNYCLYGLVNGEWKITELGTYRDEQIKSFESLNFNFSNYEVIKLNQLDSKAIEHITLKKAHQSEKEKIIHQYQRADNIDTSSPLKNQFQDTDKIYLNLVTPSTPFEEEWSKRLQPLFGVHNVRCIAKLNADKSQLQLESIEHLALNLSFSVNEKLQQLTCNQYPEYHLSTQQSIPEFNGLPHIIILENDKGEKKYIVPAFALSAGEENNNFTTDKVIDYDKFCNPPSVGPAYYTYAFNNKNEFIAENNNPAANLYLALLYRSNGDFEKAMQYLQRAKMPKNITPEIVAIALQAMQRKMKSPLASAFDLKLHCYLVEHQEKWVKEKSGDEVTKLPDDWKKMIKSQFEFYNQTFSHYKTGIAIIPEYLRLSKDEIGILFGVKKELAAIKSRKKEPQRVTTTQPKPDEMHEEKPKRSVEVPKRLKKVTQLPSLILKQSRGWRDHIQNLERALNRDSIPFSAIPPKLEFLRLYPEGKKSKTLPFLVGNFRRYLEDAISGDPKRLTEMHKDFFTLLQNDAKPEPELFEIISLLLYVSKYPHLFKDFEMSAMIYENIIKVGEVLEKHIAELAPNIDYMFKFEFPLDNVKLEVPRLSDFPILQLKFVLNKPEYEQTCKHPLGDIVKKYFKPPKDVPIAKRDFQLNLTDGLPDATSIEKRVFENYRRGHEANKKQFKTVYEVEQNDLPALKNDLKELKEKDQTKIKELKKSLLRRANRTLLKKTNATTEEKAQSHNLLQARSSGSKRKLKISDLLAAMLRQDPSYLTEQNPFLTQEDIAQLFTELADYALLNSRVDQIKQVSAMIEKKKSFADLIEGNSNYQLQLLASTLDKKRDYKVDEYPEFVIYEHATGRLLRKDQKDTLVRLIALIESDPNNKQEEMHHAMLQFAAGGGKTAVLIPILAERFARKGFLPVIFNTPELYHIGLEEIPKSLRESFELNLEVVECELEHQWTVGELEKLLADLETWRQEKKCVLLKPVTWHAINITMRLAYLNKDIKLAEAANDVLKFFKSKTVKLEDESHITSNPMQQSIKTYGEYISIPDDQLQLLLHTYDYLLGNAEDPAAIDTAKLAGIKANRKWPIDPDIELKPLQTKLSDVLTDYILAQPLFENIHITRDQIQAYLIQPEKMRPKWLNDLYYNALDKSLDDPLRYRDMSLANLIVLSRSLLNTHLPHTLDLQYLKDFGASIHPGDLTAAPKNDSKDVTSHFGDPIKVAALTVQLFHKRGLMHDQVEQFIDKLIKDHQEERNWNFNFNEPTEAEAWLLDLIPYKYNITSIYDLTNEMKLKLAHDATFTKNPDIINRYLQEFALRQVKVPKYRQTSTAADMQDGFARSIMFSATPSIRETYPAFIKPENYITEEAFEAQVIDVLLDLQNKDFQLLDQVDTPEKFFQQFSPEILKRMTTVIDRGSLLTDFKAEKVIEAYLDIGEGKAATKTAAFFEQQHLNLKSKAANIKSKIISGTGLMEELKKQGIDPRDFAVFLFYDLSKTTGTDVKRPFTDHAGLTAGQKQTVTDTVQAALRERQLLDEGAQSVTWVLFQSLYHTIDPKAAPGTFDPKKLMYWLLRNEAKDIEAKIINRAYQGIYQAISKVAWEETAKNPSKVNSSEGFKAELTEAQSLSPFEIYELDSTMAGTTKVLEGYRNRLLSQFGYEKRKIPIPKEILERVNQIIMETAHLMAELPSPPKCQLGNEVQQEMKTQLTEQQKQQQQSQMRVQNKNDTAHDFVFAKEQYSLKGDNLLTIFDRNNAQSNYVPIKLPNCEQLKHPELLFRADLFAVTKDANNNTNEPISELKPINMLLVKIMPDQSMQYCACTAAGGEYYSYLINNNLLTKTDPAYAIITTDGAILSMSNNIDLKTCHTLTNNDQSKKMCAYAEMLNGNVANPAVLAQVIKEQGWQQEDYEKIANAVTNVHVAQTPINLLKNKVLENRCGWVSEKDKQSASVNTNSSKKEKASKSKYRKPVSANVDKTEKRRLRSRKKIENQMDSSPLYLTEPKSALEGYVTGKKPLPMAKKTDNVAVLVAEFNKLQTITNDGKSGKAKQIPCRDLSLYQLNKQSKQILNSLLKTSDKVEALKTIRDEFVAFDVVVSKLYQQIQKDFESTKARISEKESGSGKDPLQFCHKVLQTIEKIYAEVGDNKTISEARAELIAELRQIASNFEEVNKAPKGAENLAQHKAAEESSSQKSETSTGGKKFALSSFSSSLSSSIKQSLFSSIFTKSTATTLYEAVTQLEKQQHEQQSRLGVNK